MDFKSVKKDHSHDLQFIKYIIISLIAMLIYRNFDSIIGGLSIIYQVIQPLLLGAIFAFVLNLIMVQIEKGYTFLVRKYCKTEKPLKFRRVFGIVASLLSIVLVIFFLAFMVIPKLSEVISTTAKAIPVLFTYFQDFIRENKAIFPEISDYILGLNIDWQDMFKRTIEFASTGISSAFGNAFTFIGSLTGKISNLLFAFIFAMYILAGKERLQKQFNRLWSFILKEDWKLRFYEILDVVNSSFSSFITGQCIEAVILGALCIFGMTLLRLPYASVIGTLIGATALIPVLGAYIGGAVGFILILTVSPIKAVYFLIFLVVLQQLEGNLIYPRVVGASIGLPGIWVFSAVTIGGGIAGIPGMLIGVPLAASIYQLMKKYIPNSSENPSKSVQESGAILAASSESEDDTPDTSSGSDNGTAEVSETTPVSSAPENDTAEVSETKAEENTVK